VRSLVCGWKINHDQSCRSEAAGSEARAMLGTSWMRTRGAQPVTFSANFLESFERGQARPHRRTARQSAGSVIVGV
jgi:hypothetical protein